MYDFVLRLSMQLQDSFGAHCLYAMPAVLAVYFFILFRRAGSRR
jgi:hypothetical protein